jgi:hypothetical protein
VQFWNKQHVSNVQTAHTKGLFPFRAAKAGDGQLVPDDGG